MGKLKTLNIPVYAYFATTHLVQKIELFINDDYGRIIINNFNFYRRTKQFKLLGYVIMPTHLHYVIWPAGRYTISEILMNFKEFTAKQIIAHLKNDSTLKKTLFPTISEVARAPRPGRVDDGPLSRRRRLDFSDDCRNFDFLLAGQDEQLISRVARAPRPGRVDDGPLSRRRRLDFSPANYLRIFKKASQNIRDQNYKAWMLRNWFENTYSIKFLQQKLDYIHNNPVKAGLVKNATDYKYSSARDYYFGDYSAIKIDQPLV